MILLRLEKEVLTLEVSTTCNSWNLLFQFGFSPGELDFINSQQLVCKIVIEIKAKKIFISVLDELKIDLRNKNQSWSIQL